MKTRQIAHRHIECLSKRTPLESACAWLPRALAARITHKDLPMLPADGDDAGIDLRCNSAKAVWVAEGGA